MLNLPANLEQKEINFRSFKYKQQDDGYIEEDVTDNPLLEGQMPAWKFQSISFSLKNLNENRQKIILNKIKEYKEKTDRIMAKYDQDREQAKRELKVLKSSHESEMKRLI